MKKHTAEEIAAFERTRHERRMPGYSRRQAERSASLFSAAVKAKRKKKARHGRREANVSDFTTLDCAIMTRIADSACTFASISANVAHLAAPLAKNPDQAFRVVDRRLQVLRKKGLIYFGNTKWFLTKSVGIRGKPTC